jgi:hypothetical protein
MGHIPRMHIDNPPYKPINIGEFTGIVTMVEGIHTYEDFYVMGIHYGVNQSVTFWVNCGDISTINDFKLFWQEIYKYYRANGPEACASEAAAMLLGIPE